MLDKKEVGDQGELIAKVFLENDGYEIIDQNIEVKGGEIDIIATKGESTVFIEVKTRLTSQCGISEDMLNRQKINKFKRSSELWAIANELDWNMRLDAICILLDPNKIDSPVSLAHYKDITAT